MSKRTLDGFFAPPAKKQRPELHKTNGENASSPPSTHYTYPWPVPQLPPHIAIELEDLVTAEGKVINNQPDLDLLYFQPFIPKSVERELFAFLRSTLFFYRVKYAIKMFGKETQINTPRYTTVFGLDETSKFAQRPDGPNAILEASTSGTVSSKKYKCQPRPIPECLDYIRRVTEAATGASFNFCLVNYYATGADSISFHSDDEYFLGPNPAIASFTLGAQRDFVMKHKPPRTDAEKSANPVEGGTLKLPLASGDMVLMRGTTHPNWLNSIPKSKGAEADRGRINITLRRAMIPAGTENYYRYNVGHGAVYRWDAQRKEMVPMTTVAG